MTEDNKQEGKLSFIAEARREQIMEAAIRTLDEIGYVNASLAQIAKRAGISTALISYHFSDKQDLMNHLLMRLVGQSTSYIMERVGQADAPTEKLVAFITASLAYQGTHLLNYSALIEIVFNARSPENVPYYRLTEDEAEPVVQALVQILRDGQERGEFGPFHVDVTANMIQGAIGEYMLNFAVTKKVDLETYTGEVVNLVMRAVRP